MKLINKQYVEKYPYKDDIIQRLKPKSIEDFINEDTSLQEKYTAEEIEESFNICEIFS